MEQTLWTWFTREQITHLLTEWIFGTTKEVHSGDNQRCTYSVFQVFRSGYPETTLIRSAIAGHYLHPEDQTWYAKGTHVLLVPLAKFLVLL